MSRQQYLKSLERNIHAAQQTIDELTRENYELRRMLQASTRTAANSDEAGQQTKKAA